MFARSFASCRIACSAIKPVADSLCSPTLLQSMIYRRLSLHLDSHHIPSTSLTHTCGDFCRLTLCVSPGASNNCVGIQSHAQITAADLIYCMQDTVETAQIRYIVKRALTDHFRAYLDGRQTKQETKQAVANLLIDEEPTMIDDFMQVHTVLHACPLKTCCLLLSACALCLCISQILSTCFFLFTLDTAAVW